MSKKRQFSQDIEIIIIVTLCSENRRREMFGLLIVNTVEKTCVLQQIDRLVQALAYKSLDDNRLYCRHERFPSKLSRNRYKISMNIHVHFVCKMREDIVPIQP